VLVRVLVVSGLAMALVTCGGDSPGGPEGPGPPIDGAAAPRRYFANVPIVLDVEKGVRYEAGHIAEDSNLLALPVDSLGIPWLEFAAGKEPPATWMTALDEIDDLVATVGAPVYLPLTPISSDRRRLTADAGTPYQPIGGPCLTGLADWEARRRGYKAYVAYLVERFEPLFLALSIEVNSYVVNCPHAWPEMRALLNEVYAEQKALHPERPIFHTFAANQLWEATGTCVGFSSSCVDANLGTIGDLSGDLFAISTYPLIVYRVNGGTLPHDWLSIFQEKTGKPIAIAETGWQFYSIETQNPDAPDECIEIPSSSDSQLWWMNRILNDAETYDMPFVVWWANRDYLPGSVSPNCACDDPQQPWCDFLGRAASDADPTAFNLRFFAMMGLREYDGTPRPSRAAWATAVVASETPRTIPTP
jgi:hypothetical protein